MHRPGHIGVALAVVSPVVGGLAALGAPELGIIVAVAAGAVSMLPDIDQRLPMIRHRGPTHTVAFALGVAGLLALVSWFFAAVVLVSILSHLLADALTPAGVTPWWPVSDAHYTWDVTLASDPIANYGLLAFGGLLTSLALTLGSIG